MHVGLHQQQQPLDVRIAEDDDVVDAAQRGDELGAIGRRQDRTARALQPGHRPIVVDRDDQAIGFGRRALQIPHVPDVQEVEAAVRERDGLARRSVARDRRDQFRFDDINGAPRLRIATADCG